MNRRSRSLPANRPTSEAAEALREIIQSNVPASLGGYLRGLARASVLAGTVVAGAITAAGCAASHFPPDSELQAPTCVDSTWQAAHDLSPARAHDSLEVLTFEGFSPAVWTLDVDGTPCASASDATCETTRAELLANTYSRYLLTTDGDLAQAHTTEAELLALLGGIDTPNEALLRVWQAGYDVQCDDVSRSGVREVAGGYEVVATSSRGGCGEPLVITRHLLFVGSEGTLTIVEEEEIERIDDPGCAGRRPEGLVPARGGVSSDAVGRWLASIARLEGAAVEAFEGLASELRMHGAPASLVDGARAAASDEVRHFAQTSVLACRFGAEPLVAEITPHAPRSLFAIALENAVEGCVRETYGALVGHHQALAASDPEVARAFAEIAEDETRHAELSWRIAAWIEPRLSDAERRELELARSGAIGELRAEMAIAPDPELVRVVGLPSARIASALLDHVAETLWA